MASLSGLALVTINYTDLFYSTVDNNNFKDGYTYYFLSKALVTDLNWRLVPPWKTDLIAAPSLIKWDDSLMEWSE